MVYKSVLLICQGSGLSLRCHVMMPSRSLALTIIHFLLLICQGSRPHPTSLTLNHSLMSSELDIFEMSRHIMKCFPNVSIRA